MQYRNSEMKIDALVSYLNEEKINLSPAFQRGHVWPLPTRRKLVRNIVHGRPIPAIFLYKEAVGSKYSYNILDGKQRLESLILFISDSRDDVKIQNWRKYFFSDVHRKHAGFAIELKGQKRKFAALSDDVLRELREYSIPTIEITLDDESSIDEVITLFVDINQQGVSVNRFDIVKAMYKNDPLMKGVFGLIALSEKRGQDVHYKQKNNEFTDVLKRLQVVANLASPNSKVDKMWEKLLEIAAFMRSKEHRNPVAILKEFIKPKKSGEKRLMVAEAAELRRVFRLLRDMRRKLGDSKLLTDQTHSYTAVTSIIRARLIDKYGAESLGRKLTKFAKLLDDEKQKPTAKLASKLKEYREHSARQTTHVSRRDARDKLFVQIMDAL